MLLAMRLTVSHCLSQTFVCWVIRITHVTPIKKASEQVDPNTAIPADLLPVLHSRFISSQFGSRRIIAVRNEQRQTEIGSFDSGMRLAYSIQAGQLFVLCMSQNVMRDRKSVV